MSYQNKMPWSGTAW